MQQPDEAVEPGSEEGGGGGGERVTEVVVVEEAVKDAGETEESDAQPPHVALWGVPSNHGTD